jgi:protein-disulfide isomerase
MKTVFLAIAALGTLVAAAPVAWQSRIAVQPNGAYAMGNPAAKVKLVEYLSYTCPHCAAFVGEATKELKAGHVARGAVHLEFRNAVRDRYDFAAALLARCGGPQRFFGNSDAIMAAQPKWLARVQGFETASGEAVGKMEPNEGLKAVVRGVGLDAVMKARGFTPAQIDACIVSKPDQERVLAMTNEAWRTRQIKGTPTFAINGRLVEGSSWSALKPQVTAALSAKR